MQQLICQRKVNFEFLFSGVKNYNLSRFQNLNKAIGGQIIIINNPLPVTSVQRVLLFKEHFPHFCGCLLNSL